MAVDVEEMDVRGLTRGEIRGLRKEEIDLQKIEKLSDEKREEALDRVFGIVCPQVDVDAITPGEAVTLYLRIIRATYVSEDTLKKFASPPALISPAGGDMSAPSAKGQALVRSGTAPKSEGVNG